MPGREFYNFSIGSLVTCIRHLCFLNNQQHESDLTLINIIKEKVNCVFSDAISRVSDENFFRENIREISNCCFTQLSKDHSSIESQTCLPTSLGNIVFNLKKVFLSKNIVK